MNNKSLVLSLILGFMFLSVSVFASNLTERNVYGILSENFTGATEMNGFSEDNINKWAGGSYGSWNAVAVVEISSSPANAKEGNKYWEFIMDKRETNTSTYWASIAFYFVDSDNSTAISKDISHFRYLDFWIRPIRGDVGNIQVGVTEFDSQTDRCKSLGSLGVTNNNEWQHVVLDLKSISGIRLNDIKNCFMMKVTNNQLSENTLFYVDNVILREDESSAEFNVTLKKVEDMQGAPSNPTEISWLYYTGWRAASQYIEIDADNRSSYGWTVMIYVDNGSASRKGLWAQGVDQEYVIPMCFRVYNGYLKNVIGSASGEQSYLIGQAAPGEKLYDRGVYSSDPGWYYPWLWMREYNEIDFTNEEDVDSITVWDSKRGYHESYPYRWQEGDASGLTDGFKEFGKSVDKTLRVYLGAGFDGAAGGIDYTATVVVDLRYE